MKRNNKVVSHGDTNINEFTDRCQRLSKEIEPIFSKYNILIGAKLVYTEQGITPMPFLADKASIKSDSTAQISTLA